MVIWLYTVHGDVCAVTSTASLYYNTWVKIFVLLVVFLPFLHYYKQNKKNLCTTDSPQPAMIQTKMSWILSCARPQNFRSQTLILSFLQKLLHDRTQTQHCMKAGLQTTTILGY